MRRALVVVGVVAAGLLLSAPAAQGHALLSSSSPANGDVLDTPPRRVVMTFTEPPDLGLSSIEMFGSTGRKLEVGDVRRIGDDGLTIGADVPRLARGTYTVSWRVLSTVDGHVTAGSFAFGMGEAVTPVAQPAGGYENQVRPSLGGVASRWAFYWGLALMLGGGLGRLFVFQVASPRWPLWIGWALAVAGLTGMFAVERAATGASTAQLLGSDRGEVLLLRGAVVVLVGAAVLAASMKAARWTAAGLVGAVALAMLVHAYAGHAGAARSFPLVQIGAQWVHLLAVGAWTGGLAWLLLLLLRRLGPEEQRVASVRRFSALATTAIPLVAITGAVRALHDVGLDVGRLTGTGFGLTVIGKSVLFAGLVALGGYNKLRVVPRLGVDVGLLARLGRTVTAEVVLAAGVFGMSGLMASLAPPAQAPAASAPQQVVARGADLAGSLHVRLVATPGTAGINRFEVRLTDEDEEPVEATGVRLLFSMPSRPDITGSELDLEEAGDASFWRGEGPNLSVEGAWRIDALVLLGGDSRTIELDVRTRLPRQDITVSEAEGQPTISTIRLAGGLTVQGFVEPGSAGANQIHLTFLTPEGSEQPMDVLRFEATPDQGTPVVLDPVKLTLGHFVAQQDLPEGRFVFRVEATTPDGEEISAYFVEHIERGAS